MNARGVDRRDERSRCEKRAVRRRGFALVAAAGAMGVPASAGAVRSVTVDIKADALTFSKTGQVEVPVYLVENRDPIADQSSFRTPRLLRGLDVNLGSLQSTFVSFTPIAGLDMRDDSPEAKDLPKPVYINNVRRNSDGRSTAQLRLYSTTGVTMPVDTSGIVGRSELLIGRLTVDVGAAIPVSATRRIVLDIGLMDTPSMPPGIVDVYTQPPLITSYTWAGTITSRRMQWFLDSDPGSTAPPSTTVRPSDVPSDPAPAPLTPAQLARIAVTTPAKRKAAVTAAGGVPVAVRPASAGGRAVVRMTVPGRLLGNRTNAPVVVGTSARNVAKGVRAVITVKPVPKWRANVAKLAGKKVRVQVVFRNRTTTKVITLT